MEKVVLDIRRILSALSITTPAEVIIATPAETWEPIEYTRRLSQHDEWDMD
jgi:hypothetical protein